MAYITDDAIPGDGKLIEKLQRLMRFHRQRVFDLNGGLHTRALYRLKRTDTFRHMCQQNRDAATIRLGGEINRDGLLAPPTLTPR